VIHEWKLDGITRNFGDALYEIFLPKNVYDDFQQDPDHLYFPIGSVICNQVILESLSLGYKPVFINCGWRGEQLDPELVAECEFVGARGPYTQGELARHGVHVEVTGDPAYQLPKLVAKGAPNALALVVRHMQDPTDYDQNSIFELGADAIFSPVVEEPIDIVEFIQKISGARFVLAGSMHAAIVADAYGVPWAPLKGHDGFIDCFPKWVDWFASREYGQPVFCKNIVEGRVWHKQIG
jgi:hypothetical protein